MRPILWVIAAVLIVLVFAGDKVRGYFTGDATEIARESSATEAAGDKPSSRGDANPSADRAEARKNTTGSYVPSPADAPELYDSPTKRLGF